MTPIAAKPPNLHPDTAAILDILKDVGAQGIGGTALREMLGLPPRRMSGLLSNLSGSNKAKNVNGLWYLRMYAPIPVKTFDRPIRNGTTSGAWTPPKMSSPRQEANDFLTVPSKVRGKDVEWAPPKPMCVITGNRLWGSQ